MVYIISNIFLILDRDLLQCYNLRHARKAVRVIIITTVSCGKLTETGKLGVKYA